MRSLTLLLAVALTASAIGCAGDRSGSEAETEEPAPDTVEAGDATDTDETTDATLLGEIPSGSPMPEAAPAGIPPYPGAIVHARYPRNQPGIQSLEAFTPDSWAVVEAFYDTTLGRGWKKTDAKDMTVYEKGADEAAITLSPWNAEDLPDDGDHPDVLRNARTAIGAAWRVDSP